MYYILHGLCKIYSKRTETGKKDGKFHIIAAYIINFIQYWLWIAQKFRISQYWCLDRINDDCWM